jgi:anaphase-promoting complex subunit 1
MAYSCAIGLLFLGGGRATLKRSDDAIAAMLCAFYPRYPYQAVDNQYHLQPLRQLYALAVDYRFIQTFDVGNGDSSSSSGGGGGGGDDSALELSSLEECSVPVTVVLKETQRYARSTIALTTPCILPELDSIESISVDSVRYWPLVLDVARVASHARAVESGWMLVKRRGGHLSYFADTSGQRSLLSRSFSRSAFPFDDITNA